MNPNRTVTTRTVTTAGALIAAALVSTLTGGCSSSTPLSSSNANPYTSSGPSYSVDYGVVDSIQTVPGGNGTSGAGAAVGGVVGGLLGNQVGGGSGRTAATVAGAVGGALAGNEIEKNRSARGETYQLGIRMNNGGYQTIRQDSLGDLRVGDRVRIENGRAYRD